MNEANAKVEELKLSLTNLRGILEVPLTILT